VFYICAVVILTARNVSLGSFAVYLLKKKESQFVMGQEGDTVACYASLVMAIYQIVCMSELKLRIKFFSKTLTASPINYDILIRKLDSKKKCMHWSSFLAALTVSMIMVYFVFVLT
jgi:hypothetical protein